MCLKRADQPAGETFSSLENLSAQAPHHFGTALRDISLRSARAKCWALAGWRATGRTNWSLPFGRNAHRRRAMIQLRGQPIGQLPPNARRRIGLLAAPEERMGHAAAPDMSLTENAVMTAVTRQKLTTRRLSALGQGTRLCRRGDQDLRRAHPGAAERRAVAVGGQPAEIRDRARDHARPRCVGRQSAHMGRRCLGRRRDPAGAAGSGRQRGGGDLYFSQDLDELMEISDRFAALNEGRLSRPDLPQG